MISNIKNLMNNNKFLENLNGYDRDDFKSGKNDELKLYNELN